MARLLIVFCLLVPMAGCQQPVQIAQNETTHAVNHIAVPYAKPVYKYEQLQTGEDEAHYYAWQQMLRDAPEMKQGEVDKIKDISNLPMVVAIMPDDWNAYQHSNDINTALRNYANPRSPFHFLYGRCVLKEVTPKNPWYKYWTPVHKNALPCIMIIGPQPIGPGKQNPIYYKVSGANLSQFTVPQLARSMMGKLVRVPQRQYQFPVLRGGKVDGITYTHSNECYGWQLEDPCACPPTYYAAPIYLAPGEHISNWGPGPRPIVYYRNPQQRIVPQGQGRQPTPASPGRINPSTRPMQNNSGKRAAYKRCAHCRQVYDERFNKCCPNCYTACKKCGCFHLKTAEYCPRCPQPRKPDKEPIPAPQPTQPAYPMPPYNPYVYNPFADTDVAPVNRPQNSVSVSGSINWLAAIFGGVGSAVVIGVLAILARRRED